MANPRGNALAAVLGVVAGLGLVEAAFRIRDDGAFPHVNFYVADAELGLRLQPGATERIAYAANPPTDFRINRSGYRGADWPSAATDGVLFVGDSQVFGLGVGEDETAAARLGATTGRVVYNAGVPTYGPPEYLAVTRELVASLHPRTVVVVVNLANDLFERSRPNRERHALWDGWAVRRETAPESTLPFPGRSWLMSQSHAVFALRQWLATRDPAAAAGFPSEGGALDLVAVAQDELRAPAPGISEQQIVETIDRNASARLSSEEELAALLPELFPELGPDADLVAQASLEHRQPGDIVGEQYAEEGRSIEVTAQILLEGVKLRGEMEARVARWVDAHPDDPRVGDIRHTLSDRVTADLALTALADRVADALPPRSPLAGFVRDMKAACATVGAELVVVALPVDVQVSAGEWRKYGLDPKDPKLDMSATGVLGTDLVEAAEELGVRALDPTAVLRAAEPGAFLDGDFHLTAKGQDVLATAIVAKLAEPAPPTRPAPGLPAGRSRVPTLAELELAPEITVTGSTRDHCSTRQLREWLYVDCSVDAGGARSAGTVRLTAGSLETWTSASPMGLRLLSPVLPERPLRATFDWAARAGERRDVPWRAGRVAELSVDWVDGAADMKFTDLPASPATSGSSGPAAGGEPLEAAACAQALVGRPHDLGRGCVGLLGPAVPGGGRTETEARCAPLVACATGRREPMAVCGPGEVNAGAGGLCYTACESGPCAEGECQDWMGARVCL